MNTLEIEKTLKKLSVFFCKNIAVCALDEFKIPKNGYPFYYVVNLDPIRMPGSHWAGGCFPAPYKAWIHDSLGSPPPDELKEQVPHLEYSSVRVQSLFTENCGQFAIFFLFLCALYKNFKTVQTKLLKVNDYSVSSFVNCVNNSVPIKKYYPLL